MVKILMRINDTRTGIWAWWDFVTSGASILRVGDLIRTVEL